MAKQIVKKKWFKILAPQLFGERLAGETPSIDGNLLVGRVVSANMSTLTDDMKKQSHELKMIIESVDNDKAKTRAIGYRLLPTSTKRLVRRGRTRIDQTIKIITKDEQVVTIKFLFITGSLVKGSVFTALQEEAKKFIIKKATNLTFDPLCELAITEELQHELRQRLAKIYPLRICELKGFLLERNVKAADLRRIKADLAKEQKKPEKEVKEEEEIPEETEEKQPETTETQEEASEDVSEEAEEKPSE